jgi:hypothetical protein
MDVYSQFIHIKCLYEYIIQRNDTHLLLHLRILFRIIMFYIMSRPLLCQGNSRTYYVCCTAKNQTKRFIEFLTYLSGFILLQWFFGKRGTCFIRQYVHAFLFSYTGTFIVFSLFNETIICTQASTTV